MNHDSNQKDTTAQSYLGSNPRRKKQFDIRQRSRRQRRRQIEVFRRTIGSQIADEFTKIYCGNGSQEENEKSYAAIEAHFKEKIVRFKTLCRLQRLFSGSKSTVLCRVKFASKRSASQQGATRNAFNRLAFLQKHFSPATRSNQAASGDCTAVRSIV